jgi:hypothetical protein
LVERYLAKVQVASSNLVSRSKYKKPLQRQGFFVCGTWQFSASVAPLDSRSKTIKPLRRQGFFVCGTPVLSECRTTDFPLQIQKNPATSGVFCVWYVTIALLAQQFSASVAPLDSRAKTIKPLQRQGFNARGTASSQRMSHHCFAAPMTRTLASRDFALGNRYICSRRTGSASGTSRPLLASCKGHAQKAMPLRVEILERLRDRSALAASGRRQTTNPSPSPRQ